MRIRCGSGKRFQQSFLLHGSAAHLQVADCLTNNRGAALGARPHEIVKRSRLASKASNSLCRALVRKWQSQLPQFRIGRKSEQRLPLYVTFRPAFARCSGSRSMAKTPAEGVGAAWSTIGAVEVYLALSSPICLRGRIYQRTLLGALFRRGAMCDHVVGAVRSVIVWLMGMI